MKVSDRQLEDWLTEREHEHLEFKEAKSNFHFEKLVKYCSALANEGGGSIILGVTDTRPRRIVGSSAFPNLERTKAGLVEKLRLRIEADAISHPHGRVVVFTAPARPLGVPIPVDGGYWMRAGEDLVPMTPDMLRRIFAEAGPDFSAEVCPGATLADLDTAAIELFRSLWQKKAPEQNLGNRSSAQLLADAELVVPAGVTYAALILLGTREALGRHLGQGEIIFEYRSNDAPGPAAVRREHRQGFLPVLDELWQLINLRNARQHFQQGLFVWDVLTFDESAVREAILNAVSHRDYRSSASVFVRQYPHRIEIVSPGGFPAGITVENVLWQQNPRNRRLAEALSRCGLVERAGQGFDLIYRQCIRQGKRLPDLTRTDDYSVWLTLHGEIQDPEFLRFLEQVGRERMSSYSTEDFLVIDLVHRDQRVPEFLKSRIPHLLDEGVIERVGRGRGVRYILSRRFYRFLGKGGVYTRRRGLDRETNKALLLKHIEDSQTTGSKMEELRQVLPAHSRSQIQVLLRELKANNRIHVHGTTKAALWYPGPEAEDCNHGQGRLQ